MSLGLRLERPLVLFDLEATGSNPMKDRVFQIALKVYNLDGTEEEHYTYINPEVSIPRQPFFEERGYTDELITAGCARCGHNADKHPSEACPKWRPIPRFCEVAKPLFTTFVGADFAGYNLKRFDLPLIKEEFARCEMAFDYSKASVICGLRLWQILEPRTLSDAVEHWGGRKIENAHDAMADVRGTELALQGMLRQPNLPQTVTELGELLFPRDTCQIDDSGKFRFINGRACFNFGKLKGQRMDSDPGYLKWMLNGDFSADVKRIVRDALEGKLPSAPPEATGEVQPF